MCLVAVLAGVVGAARVIACDWPFDQQLTREEIYALRDRSGLSRQQFYMQHWGRKRLGEDGSAKEQHA